MGWISVLFPYRVIDLAVGGGDEGEAARRTLFRSIGVDPQGPVDPGQMIPDGDFFGLLERIVEAYPCARAIGVRVGASVRCDDYGAFGLAFKSAVDLWGAYQRVERYGRVVTSIANFRVVPGDDGAFMEVIPGWKGRLGLRMTHELALAAAATISREVCQRDFIPRAVHIAHEAPADIAEFEAHFRCPIRFGGDRDALEVPGYLLRSPNRLGDEGISGFFDAHLDGALDDLPEDGGLGRRVQAEISQSLSEGVPKLPRVAERLGMSGRTLQRRLSASGLAYQALVDEARRELAFRLLQKSTYDLAEIAFLTGFSEQSTFSRAFKRWSGQTPRAYRLSSRA